MKKNVIKLIALVCLISVLVLLFEDYSFYLNEPFVFENSMKSYGEINYAQDGYYNDSEHSLYTMKIENTILNSLFYTILKNNPISSQKYANNYIVKVNNKTNNVEKKLYWNENKYGTVKSAAISSNGDIYVLSYKYSADLSSITEENIIKYDEWAMIGKPLHNIKHDKFVNELNKTIQNIDILHDELVWTEYDGNFLNINSYDEDKLINSKQFKIKSEINSRLNNIVLMDDLCYLTLSDNRLYKLSYEGAGMQLIKNFNEDKSSVYKLYKYDNDKIFAEIHKSFGETLEIYDGNSFESLNLNGLPAEAYLKEHFVNNLSNYNFSFEIFKVFVICIYIMILVLMIIWIRYFYVHILNKKIYITFKLVLSILPILLAGNYFIASFSAVNNYKMVEKELFLGKIQQFNDYCESKNMQINTKYGHISHFGDLLDRITIYEDISKSVTDEIYSIMDYEFTDKPFDTEGWYWSVDIVSDGCMYKIIDSELNDTVFFSRYVSGSNSVADDVIKGNSYTTMDFDDKYIFGLYPVKNSSEEVVGMVQIGTYYYGFKNELYGRFFSENSKKISIMTNILLVVLIFITFKSLFPLLKFARKIEGFENGKIQEIQEINSNDEIQILTHAFNTMSRNINENMDRMAELNNSYYRFVPLELIKLLGKEDIKDVNLGDSVDKNITILCVGISNFYDVMGKNQAGKIFGIMSDIHEYISPIVRKHGGVVDRFTDKGLTAMFPKSAEGAVGASVEIVKTVRELNFGQNKFDGINLSCAINSGEVTFGIIGEEKRLQNTTISYTTNYAVIMQENSDKLSSSIVVSKSVFEKLNKNVKILFRYLGKIKFGVIDDAIELYDIYEGDSSNSINMKNINRDEFENAVKKYAKGDYYSARQGFVKVLDRDIEEEIARIYFYQSDAKINEIDAVQNNAGVLEI